MKKGIKLIEETKEDVIRKDNAKQDSAYNRKSLDIITESKSYKGIKSLPITNQSITEYSIICPKAQVKESDNETKSIPLFRTNMKHAVIAYYIFFGYDQSDK